MPCVYFHPNAYSISGEKLMGRQAAGNSFLEGLIRYVNLGQDDLYVLTKESSHYDSFLEFHNRLNTDVTPRNIAIHDMHLCQEAGLLYYPGPDIAQQAFYRRSWSDKQWSLCGITHTTSSAGAMDAITAWITSPVQPWDAVICTSNAVKQNVEAVLQAEVDYLKERLGITKLVLPQLPVIPLGIHTDHFQYTVKERADARKKIGVKESTLVVLYTGRLSFHAKAHPLPMYQALENAVRATGKEVVLVECGWHANEHIKDAFAAGVNMVSPSITAVTLDGRNPENRDAAWASADIFCSLSDNIQETFGIVPIEAMSAGLPVVVSDWDGYKDTVRDGIDGFRIPTLAPAPGLAGDLAHRHALEIDTYDMYCGHTSSLVAVDVTRLTQAFVNLFQSPDLRSEMGAAGRLRATQYYDWRQIIPRYAALWEELTELRRASDTNAEDADASSHDLTSSVWPARLDPTITFANYPTQHLTLSTRLTLAEPNVNEAEAKLAQYMSLAMVNYAAAVFPTKSEALSVLRHAEAALPNSCSAESLLVDILPDRRPYVLRGLAWLCKLGLLRFS